MTDPLEELQLKLKELFDHIQTKGLFTSKEEVLFKVIGLINQAGALEETTSAISEVSFENLNFKRHVDGKLFYISTIVFDLEGQPASVSVIDPADKLRLVDYSFDQGILIDLNEDLICL